MDLPTIDSDVIDPAPPNCSSNTSYIRHFDSRYIYNGGRRCGDGSEGIHDRSSLMCNGSGSDGSFKHSVANRNRSEAALQARCTRDERCVGYWAVGKQLRPMAAWDEGARFPVDYWRRYDKKQLCTLASPLPPPLRSQSFMVGPPPWPALIISGSLERYARAMLAARELGFTSVHVAAAYPPIEAALRELLRRGAKPTTKDVTKQLRKRGLLNTDADKNELKATISRIARIRKEGEKSFVVLL